jgi:cytochrome d ubiquinol oxidase subunit II
LAPHRIVSTVDPANSLTIARAASSHKTLVIMTIMACLGMPFVLSYTITIYWIFRGKVQLDRFSY